MRLTLRYLLAYLDDVLKPTDAATVGRIIKENKSVRDLAERLRKIIRMRRLAAPDPHEKRAMVSANDVAEYLDNLTPPDKVAEFESECMKSDERLAEVAATHQILSQVLGGRPTIPSTTKPNLQKIAMSFLPDDSEFDDDQNPGSSVAIPAMEAPTIAATATPEVDIPFEIRRQQGDWRQFVAILGILVLVGAWVYSIATDRSFRGAADSYTERRFDRVENRGKNEQIAALPEGTSTVEKPATAPPRPASTSMPVAAADTTAPRPPGSPRPTSTTQPPTTPPEMQPAAPAPGEENGEAIAANMKPAEVQPDVPPVAPNPILFAPQVQFVSADRGLILDDSGPTGSISVLAPQGVEPRIGNALYTPPYSTADFTVNGNSGRLHLRENAAARLIGCEEMDCLALELIQGQFIIESLPQPAERPLEKAQLVIDGLTWTILLPEEATRLMIDVRPQMANHFEQLPAEGLTITELWVEGAPVQIQPPNGAPVDVKEYHSVLPVDSAAPAINAANGNPPPANAAAEPPAVAPVDQPLPPPQPAWTDGGPLQMTLAQRRDQQEFMKYLERSTNLWLDMQGVANDPNPRIAELATRVLSLGRRYESLVTILARSQHEESRTEAIAGLRVWLPQDPENRTLVMASLEKTFTPGTADLVYSLLWGFDTQDARKPDISRRLVNGLRHEHVAVRELSIYWISNLTGQRLGYRPLAVLATREQAVTSWERHLDRVGALLPPEQ
ncbi:hypothetical protein [Rubinisphaera margarita]|uniref:hypothetical protein n=1 Tax=Rubinisphaera margarita TaxID=2909586 RepID=UPI001EE910AF|nr:hypothetical protein [Rubinisphaera margarita]MCG6157457.1 hypothetical protein [Rubinisphaera margarita]